MLSIGVLGPLVVTRDGAPVSVPSGRPTELLVRLALDAGRTVGTERLIDDLWGGQGTSRNTLQSKVSQLRRALGDAKLVVGTAAGYSLTVDPAEVDALRVVDLAAASAAARVAGDHERTARIAAEALALFRGDPLAGAGDGEWVHPQQVRFSQMRLGLEEDRLAAAVALGSGGEVVGELEALVARYPLSEGLWGTLITALYRTGRQADALSAYRRVRKVLVEELGIEPGPELRAIEAQVLSQDPALAPARPVLPPGNLPAISSPMIGRGGALKVVNVRIFTSRLVTIIGPAGIGKTRLAIEVGRGLEAPGGVWMVRLDAIDDAAALPAVVARTLGVDETTLHDRLAVPGTVLILDNCEHLVGPLTDPVADLLTVPGLRILATSQRQLGVEGEVTSVVFPLEPDDARQLFAERATATRPAFELDATTTGVVDEVCHQLDGLPLAIELAAARVRSLSVQEIARRLDDRFAFLQDPTSDRPERRRALGAAISWSYDLLFPDDQRGLWALAGFVGGAPLPAAEEVLAALDVPVAAAIDVYERLVDRSMAIADIGDGGSVRYRLLDSIRAFAAARCAEAGATDVVAAAHAQWFARSAERTAAGVRGLLQAECLAEVRADRANVDAALAWTSTHDPALGARIAVGLSWAWVVLGDGTAGAARLRAAVTTEAGMSQRTEAGLVAGWLEASAGDVELADRDIAGAAELVEVGDERALADVQRHRAFVRIQQGRAHDVLADTAAALVTYRSRGLTWETVGCLLLGSFGAVMTGDVATADAMAGEASALVAPIGDAWGQVHASAMLGAIAELDGRLTDAVEAMALAADASERLGFPGQAALHLAGLGRVQLGEGQVDAAEATLRRAVAAATSVGDLRLASSTRTTLARALVLADRHQEAVDEVGAAVRWFDSAGGGEGADAARQLLTELSA